MKYGGWPTNDVATAHPFVDPSAYPRRNPKVLFREREPFVAASTHSWNTSGLTKPLCEPVDRGLLVFDFCVQADGQQRAPSFERT